LNFLSAAGRCGCDPRHLAAGYNGGAGACSDSDNCTGCSMCNGTTRKWECLWDDDEHTDCNSIGTPTFKETRDYVPKVNYCYSQF